jgi:hypothetical protein
MYLTLSRAYLWISEGGKRLKLAALKSFAHSSSDSWSRLPPSLQFSTPRPTTCISTSRSKASTSFLTRHESQRSAMNNDYLHGSYTSQRYLRSRPSLKAQVSTHVLRIEWSAEFRFFLIQPKVVYTSYIRSRKAVDGTSNASPDSVQALSRCD